jgi:hypothetical protein
MLVLACKFIPVLSQLSTTPVSAQLDLAVQCSSVSKSGHGGKCKIQSLFGSTACIRNICLLQIFDETNSIVQG